MLNLKFAFFGLSKRILFTVLTIIQLSASFILLYTSIYLYDDLAKNNNNVIKYFNNKAIYTLRNNEDYYPDLFKTEEPKKYEDFYNYLNTSRNFIHISYEGTYLLLKDFKYSEKFVQTTMYSVENAGRKFVAANALIIDEHYLNYFPLFLLEGRSFTEDDFKIYENQNAIPVMLGASYKKIFNLGEEWEYVDNQTNELKKIKVIGFLKNNQIFTNTALPLNNIKSLDNFIVFPNGRVQRNISEDSQKQKKYNTDYKINLYNHIMNSVVVITQENRQEQIIKDLETKAKEIGFFDIQALNSKKELDKQKKLYQQQNLIINALFIIILTICSIGIVSNMLYSIIKRYKEFGVHVLTGARVYDIAMRIFLEVLILILISLVFSFLGVDLLKNSNIVQLQLVPFLKLVIVSFILAIFVSLIPVIYVVNIQVNNLLRRAE
jgi:putative ABC transport system permease protein